MSSFTDRLFIFHTRFEDILDPWGYVVAKAIEVLHLHEIVDTDATESTHSEHVWSNGYEDVRDELIVMPDGRAFRCWSNRVDYTGGHRWTIDKLISTNALTVLDAGQLRDSAGLRIRVHGTPTLPSAVKLLPPPGPIGAIS